MQYARRKSQQVFEQEAEAAKLKEIQEKGMVI